MPKETRHEDVTLDEVGASPIDHPSLGALTVKMTEAACKAVAFTDNRVQVPALPPTRLSPP
jgi:hypothetical protein